jgi:hypothetical protein
VYRNDRSHFKCFLIEPFLGLWNGPSFGLTMGTGPGEKIPALSNDERTGHPSINSVLCHRHDA